MKRITSLIDLKRIARFGLVGASGVAVNTAVLYFSHEVVSLPLALASLLAVELAIINNFFLNNAWTFAERSWSLRRLARFNLVSLGGMAITTSALLMLVHVFALHYLFANLLAISLSMSWNYLANSFWTWGAPLQ